MTKYEEAAARIAKLVAEKNKAYGNSVETSAKILAILYPNGIKPEQYEDVLVMTRMLDKMSRIANDPTAFGENPWEDMNGYTLVKVVGGVEKKQAEKPPQGPVPPNCDVCGMALFEHNNVWYCVNATVHPKRYLPCTGGPNCGAVTHSWLCQRKI